MTDKPLSCWICAAVNTSDNPVDIINSEQICAECQHELKTIDREQHAENIQEMLKALGG